MDPIRKRKRKREGEMYHQPDGKKAAVEETESMGRLKKDVMEIEMEVDAGVPQAESADVDSPKRKVIRGESVETQDYVCETLSISPEEAEELAFVPSAISEPRGAIYFCDIITSVKKRSDTGSLRRWSLKVVERLEQ